MTRFRISHVWVGLIGLVGGACSNTTTTTGLGMGSAVEKPTIVIPLADVKITTCESARPKIEALYRNAVPKKQLERVDAFVADNTTMVLNDCAKAPATAVPCLAAAQSVEDLEAKCVAALDDEGTDGDALRK